jgi:hypothetical protein
MKIAIYVLRLIILTTQWVLLPCVTNNYANLIMTVIQGTAIRILYHIFVKKNQLKLVNKFYMKL